MRGSPTVARLPTTATVVWYPQFPTKHPTQPIKTILELIPMPSTDRQKDVADGRGGRAGGRVAPGWEAGISSDSSSSIIRSSTSRRRHQHRDPSPPPPPRPLDGAAQAAAEGCVVMWGDPGVGLFGSMNWFRRRLNPSTKPTHPTPKTQQARPSRPATRSASRPPPSRASRPQRSSTP